MPQPRVIDGKVVKSGQKLSLDCPDDGPPEETEACCLGMGCGNVLPSVCLELGGVPQGPGTTCADPGICGPPPEDCFFTCSGCPDTLVFTLTGLIIEFQGNVIEMPTCTQALPRNVGANICAYFDVPPDCPSPPLSWSLATLRCSTESFPDPYWEFLANIVAFNGAQIHAISWTGGFIQSESDCPPFGQYQFLVENGDFIVIAPGTLVIS